MDNKKILNFVYVVVGAILLVGGLYLLFGNRVSDTGSGLQATTTAVGVEYKNSNLGFSVKLPDSWKNFSAVDGSWEGYSLDATGKTQIKSETGITVSVRHPLWTSSAPRQDIPVMVFSLKQWSDMQADKFHAGAAPINPSELGRNSKYVFALPARYNFAYITGFEEVETILQSGAFKAF